jgi:hypothetical protein
VDDTTGLEKLLKLFFGYQRPEIADFRKAVEQFKADLSLIRLSISGYSRFSKSVLGGRKWRVGCTTSSL